MSRHLQFNHLYSHSNQSSVHPYSHLFTLMAYLPFITLHCSNQSPIGHTLIPTKIFLMKSMVSLSSYSSTQSPIFINKALQLSPQSYTIPTIISKGKGKSKLPLDDDVPLVLLKKQRCGYKAPSTSLFDIEVAVLFLTKLQHLTPIRGLVYNFLNSPLIETFG
jgi:hypothetical protein